MIKNHTPLAPINQQNFAHQKELPSKLPYSIKNAYCLGLFLALLSQSAYSFTTSQITDQFLTSPESSAVKNQNPSPSGFTLTASAGAFDLNDPQALHIVSTTRKIASKLMSPARELRLAVRGSGVFDYYNQTVYEAFLLTPTASHWSAKLPFTLAVFYQRNVSEADLLALSEQELKRIYKDQYQDAWLEQLRAVYTPIKEGDLAEAHFNPNCNCTKIYKNKELVGELKGSLALAFFGIWLHPETPNTQLRANLLGLGLPESLPQSVAKLLARPQSANVSMRP